MLVTILSTAEIVYVVVLATWILFEKRPPVSTLAWILALVALPYVGFVIFFFFGPRRVDRKRLRHRRARGRVRDARGVRPDGRRATASKPAMEAPDPRVVQLERLATSAGEPPSDVCREVTILPDATSTYDAIERAVDAAEHHAHVAYYIFDSGRAGTRLIQALVRRARAGVTVRVLVDAVGSSAMSRAAIAEMRAAGVKFARFNPVRFARVRGRIDFRNHRKIVVCDGQVGFTGGINVCDEYLPAERSSAPGAAPAEEAPQPWRDTHVRLEGDGVRWLQLTFLDDWQYATGYVPREPEYFPPTDGEGSHRMQIVASGPDRDVQPIQSLYFAAITLASQRVYVTTPYFVPDDAILTALTTAAMRGVDVRILVPRRSDSLVVTAAARSYYDEVLTAGARVYEYQPAMIHAKTLVIDDWLAAVGTANMDNRSFHLNFEVSAVLYGAGHARTLAAQFDADLAVSREITKETRTHLPLGWRIAEVGARVLSPLL